MKADTLTRFGHRAAWLLAVALIFAHSSVQACPGCKQNTTPGADGAVPPLNGASIGFGLSIFLMIFLIVALLGGLGFMMYRSCQTIAARQEAEMARLDAEEGMPSVRAEALQLRPA